MKFEDYVRALTAALVEAQPEARRTLAAQPSDGLNLSEPCSPGKASIAVRSASGELEGLAKWLEDARETRGQDTRVWGLEALHSPSFAFTPAQFLALIDAQAAHEALWRRLEQLVRESQELNSEPVVEPSGVRAYLLAADSGYWGLMADQFLQEMEIECLVEGSPLTLPDELASLFRPGEPLLPEDEIEFSVYLYSLRSVTVDELALLVEAQNLPNLAKLRKLLSKPEVEDYVVCRAICEACEAARVTPVIPESLTEAFGPSAIDQKRAQFRGAVSGGGGWQPEPFEQPWTCYVWQPVNGRNPIEPLKQTIPHLEAALRGLEGFATQHDSGFAKVFGFALSILAGSSFPAEADELPKVGPVQELALLGWDSERLRAFAACGEADVFGGMGSWNDQDFGDDNEECSRLNGALFSALKRVWTAMLAPKAS